MEAPLNGPVDAFRAVDAFAVDAWKVARQLARGDGDALSQELRAQVARCGGALARCRFALYLARRLGLVDLRAYRALSARGDAAARELSARGP